MTSCSVYGGFLVLAIYWQAQSIKSMPPASFCSSMQISAIKLIDPYEPFKKTTDNSDPVQIPD